MTAPALPRRVTIVEVGPRDGLQNEAAGVGTAGKIAFVDALAAAGLRVIEATAFVSPKWVPQLADAEAVLRGLTPRPGVRYPVLVPNLRGARRALDAGATELAIVAAASESFSRRNINQGIDESLDEYARVCAEATGARAAVRGYVSTVFGCPFEGPVPVSRVVEVAARLLEMGAFQVALSDTIGVAHPRQVWDALDDVQRAIPLDRIALHFHDTRGTALANALAGLQAGVTTFDASAGGLGGCPYAPGATGNLATEDLVYMLDGLGIETGVNVQAVAAASLAIEPHVGHPVPSRFVRAFAASQKASGQR